jgi:WD40 repeat protein/serine/threonine protein kinase
MAPSSSGKYDRLDRLAEEFAARYRRGERPSLQEYVDRHPDLADDIRDLFPALAEVERAEADRPEPPSPRSEAPVGQVGDYRILRKIGEGGMGVVYEAEQLSLGRHVALKVLPQKLLRDARQERRFEREARAAARLHHTNIVPVFAVGQQEGMPYYAMQFIQGLGLDAVIEELKRLRPAAPGGTPTTAPEQAGSAPAVSAADVARSLLTGRFEPAITPGSSAESDGPAVCPDEPRPDGSTLSASSVVLPGQSGDGRTSRVKKQTYWQSVARVGVQVADALDYAHKQGILHRDVKPSNLLLDTHGTVWVTDFGLAKVVGPGEAAENLTRTGDVLGTLRYMSPEALDGRTDARSDVYGLGLTLYELLALRPAFDATDRSKLIKQVTGAEPARLEWLNPAIPRDLATVVHKAMERDAALRYASAAELAADLQRFIDDEPIKARRLGLSERCRRWCRHNPAVAGLTAAVFVLLVAVAAVASVGLVQTALALGREAEQRHTAEQEREAARAAEARARAEAAWSRRVLYDADMHLAAQLWESPNGPARAVLDLLETHRPRPGEDDLRDFAWHYQWRLCHDTLTLPGHSGPPLVALAADGHIVTFDGAHVLRRWDRAGRVVGSWSPETVEGERYRWDLSADGALLAAGTARGDVILYDTATGRKGLVLEGPAAVAGLSFAPDGPWLATAHEDDTARVWDVRDGKPRATIGLQGSAFEHCVLGPRGEALLLGGQPDHSQASLYRPGGAPPLVRGLTTSLGSVACSPDGRWFAAGDGMAVVLWDATTGEPINKLPSPEGGAYAMAFSPDGSRLALGGVEGLVTVWDPVGRQRLLQLKGHTAQVTRLRFGADGKSLVSAAADGTAKLWDLSAREGFRRLPPVGDGDTHTPWLAYSPDSRWLAVAGRPTRLWDARTRRPGRPFEPAVRAAFSPDGKTLALGDGEGRVQLCDVDTGRVLRTWEGRPDERGEFRKVVGALAFSPDGRLLAAGFGAATWWEDDYEQSARVWDVASGQAVQALAHQNAVPALAFSADGTLLATASRDGALRLWPAGRWQEVRTLRGSNRFNALAFAPRGDLLATSGDDFVIRLWDAASGQVLRVLQGHSYHVFGLAFSGDGKTLASASWDRTIKLWDVVSGRELRTLTGHPGWVHCVAFAPDGSALASCDNSGMVHLWEAVSGRQREGQARDVPAEKRE